MGGGLTLVEYRPLVFWRGTGWRPGFRRTHLPTGLVNRGEFGVPPEFGALTWDSAAMLAVSRTALLRAQGYGTEEWLTSQLEKFFIAGGQDGMLYEEEGGRGL